RLPTLRLALSSGAPFPVALLGDFLEMIAPDGDIFTPYGATESLPVAAIGAREILSETAEKTRHGRGTCVGKRFEQIRWKIIPITDTPLPRLEDIPPVPPGEIGELIVTGPQVTRLYVTRTEANALSKITDAQGDVWHRIGDLGWIDEQERFWFCGRKAHRVETFENGTLFSVPCESIFNTDERIARSALAGYPDPEYSGCRIPVIYLEPKNWPNSEEEKKQLLDSMRALAQSSPLTRSIGDLRLLRSFPVDIRHNAKINREKLSAMAAQDQH
ncbi:MAG: AMP-binding protein, partial [Thermoguttaceae bacterium]|nr:AMP-binding protein [Thermoguttaceae bacterium]